MLVAVLALAVTGAAFAAKGQMRASMTQTSAAVSGGTVSFDVVRSGGALADAQTLRSVVYCASRPGWPEAYGDITWSDGTLTSGTTTLDLARAVAGDSCQASVFFAPHNQTPVKGSATDFTVS
jgi:hypothetical protein